jgi:hypothetical protein
MLVFVDLIPALTTRRRKVPNSCFQGEFCIKGRVLHQGKNSRGSFASREEFCIKGRKFGRNAFVQGELAFMHLGSLFHLNFSCALLPMVSSPFASL